MAESDGSAMTHHSPKTKIRNDDKLLETALMGEADCLITGDWDFPETAPFHGIPILTPAGFLALWTRR